VAPSSQDHFPPSPPRREALSFTLPGFQGIAKARNPKGGGVAVLVRLRVQTVIITRSLTASAWGMTMHRWPTRHPELL
jgi:hypothetical protein